MKADVFPGPGAELLCAGGFALQGRHPAGNYDALIRSVRQNLEPLFATTLCASASWVWMSWSPTPMCRWWRRSRPTSPSTKRSPTCSPHWRHFPARNTRSVRRGSARALVRSFTSQKGNGAALVLRQLRRAALHPDELQARRLLQAYTLRMKRGTQYAHLVCATKPSIRIQLPIFPFAEVTSTFNEELAQPLPARAHDRSENARLRRRSPDRRHRRVHFSGRRCVQFETVAARWRRAGAAITWILKPNIANCLRLVSVPAWCSIPSSISSACVFRISTMRFTSTNMPPASRPRSRCPERVLNKVPGAVRPISVSWNREVSKFPLETLQAAGVDMRTPAPVREHAAFVRSPPERARSAPVASAFNRKSRRRGRRPDCHFPLPQSPAPVGPPIAVRKTNETEWRLRSACGYAELGMDRESAGRTELHPESTAGPARSHPRLHCTISCSANPGSARSPSAASSAASRPIAAQGFAPCRILFEPAQPRRSARRILSERSAGPAPRRLRYTSCSKPARARGRRPALSQRVFRWTDTSRHCEKRSGFEACRRCSPRFGAQAPLQSSAERANLTDAARSGPGHRRRR